MAQPKPPISAWIASERKRMGWKVEELSRRLLEAGYPAEVSTIRVWEAGRAPRAETIEALGRLFDSAPPANGGDQGLAAVVSELVEEVRLGRLAQERTEERLTQMLAALVHVAVGEEAWSRIQSELVAPAPEGTR